MRVFKNPENGKWYIDFTMTIGDKKQRFTRIGGQTKREAEIALARLKTEKVELRRSLKEGTARPEKKPDLLFSEFAKKKFLPADSVRGRREKTRASHETSVNNLNAFFGQKYLSQITKEDVDQYIQDRKRAKVRKRSKTGFKVLERTLSNASINREITCLKQILKLAVKYGYLQANPAVEAVKLSESPKWTILKDDEVRRLIEAARPGLKPILRLLLQTGMRKNEALKLSWAFPGYERKAYQDEAEARSAVDLNRSRIFIPKELAKNHKSREVPLSSDLVEMFKELRKAPDQKGPVFNVKEIKRSFQSACKKAELPKLRIHDLRHTAASRMIEAGINVVDVCDILGHSDLKITMRYCHASIENKRQAVERLGEIYGSSREKVEIPAPAPISPTPLIPLKLNN
jgi:integrase